MKKLFLSLVLVGATIPALAQHHGHGYRHNGGHYRGYYGSGWVAPLVIGGVVGYALTRPDPVIIQQQPVIVQQQPTPNYGQSQNCSPWTEVQNSDGTTTRTRTCEQ
jgi:hypothetical protein